MNRKSITRILICLQEGEEGTNSKKYNKILRQFNALNINHKLATANNKLYDALKREIPGLSINCESAPNINNVSNVPNYNNIRFVLHDTVTTITSDIISKNNSHVVEITLFSDNYSAINGSVFEYTALIKTEKEIYSIIEDVMLDIQMFHFWGLDLDYKTLNDKKDFSILKVKFCNNHFINPNVPLKYCSIATTCRDKELQLNYQEYIKKWEKFINFIKPIDDMFVSPDTKKIVELIIKKHPYGMQISRKKLSSMISNLSQGRYVLVFLYSRPRNRKDIKILFPMMKGSKLKRGTIKVITYDSLYKYKKQSKYLYLQIFEI